MAPASRRQARGRLPGARHRPSDRIRYAGEEPSDNRHVGKARQAFGETRQGDEVIVADSARALAEAINAGRCEAAVRGAILTKRIYHGNDQQETSSGKPQSRKNIMKKKSEPLVSVITPVYNGEKFLSECLESVRTQTYSSFEHIIVNNCSTDRTLEIAQEYASKDPRIRVHNNSSFQLCKITISP